MSRLIEEGEDLDGAILVAKKGTRQWRAQRVERLRGYDDGSPVYWLNPLGGDVRPAQEHGRFNGGVRRIASTENELRRNGWRRVA